MYARANLRSSSRAGRDALALLALLALPAPATRRCFASSRSASPSPHTSRTIIQASCICLARVVISCFARSANTVQIGYQRPACRASFKLYTTCAYSSNLRRSASDTFGLARAALPASLPTSSNVYCADKIFVDGLLRQASAGFFSLPNVRACGCGCGCACPCACAGSNMLWSALSTFRVLFFHSADTFSLTNRSKSRADVDKLCSMALRMLSWRCAAM